MIQENVAVTYSSLHIAHQSRLIDPCEVPSRAEGILKEIRSSFPGIPIIEPAIVEQPLVRQIHLPAMIDQLAVASQGPRNEPAFTRFVHDKTNSTPIWEGTYQSALASVSCSLSAAQLVVDGEASRTYSINRPPGHHAGYDFYHGFSFMNNAMITAKMLEQQSASVAVFDFDFHHGNGTQNLVNQHGGVSYVSTHGDPSFNFPFTGESTDRGYGKGVGLINNYPYEAGASVKTLRTVIGHATDRLATINPDVLVVSAGFDAHKTDHPPGIPSPTEADSSFFEDVAAKIGALGIPTIVVLEGGYGDHLPESFMAFFKTLNKYDIK
ncbi:MAG: hypothetical protein WC851_04855 [Candidatus Shapirobacteria bacterium]|jgi:acetoin utilization deacetylase AcuC-like enzyme